MTSIKWLSDKPNIPAICNFASTNNNFVRVENVYTFVVKISFIPLTVFWKCEKKLKTFIDRETNNKIITMTEEKQPLLGGELKKKR